MNFCVIEDGQIYFSPVLRKPNDLDHVISYVDLLTPCGFFIPLDYHAMSIIDALTGGIEDLCPGTRETTVGILLDHRERVYEVVFTTKGNVADLSRRRIIIGKAGYVRTFGHTEEEHCYEFARFLGTSPIDSLKEVFFEHYPLQSRVFEFTSIENIIKDLKGMGLTKPFPRKQNWKT
jgi:hypothetical protein